ncbi:hypothetical protein SprV_0501976100 [Sparganum proliferum]
MFSVRLMDSHRNESPGVRIAYGKDDQLSNQQLIHCQSHVSKATVHEILFADDYALNDTSEGGMKRSVDIFDAARDSFGLVINVVYIAPRIRNGTQLQMVDNMNYLAITPFHTTKIDDKEARQISRSSQAFGCVQNTVRNWHGLPLNTKLKM